jgi:hypothetical protein
MKKNVLKQRRQVAEQGRRMETRLKPGVVVIKKMSLPLIVIG